MNKTASISRSPATTAPSTVEEFTATPHRTSIRLHAHTEALEDSLSRSSKGRRSQGSPQISVTSFSPQKRSTLSEISSIAPSSPSKSEQQRGIHTKFNTLPVPKKTEFASKDKAKDSSTWSFSGVKLEQFCKNLLKKPKTKQSKDASPTNLGRNNKLLANGRSEKGESSKERLSRTSSEPRIGRRSKLDSHAADDDAEVGMTAVAESERNTKENDSGKKKKREKFIKKKAKSASLLQKNTDRGTSPLLQSPTEPTSVPTKIKIKFTRASNVRENQSLSGEDGLNLDPPQKNKKINPRGTRTIEIKSPRPEDGETFFRVPSIFRTRSTSTGKDLGFHKQSRNHKARPSSDLLPTKIEKLEREPRRRTRDVNSDTNIIGSGRGIEDDDFGFSGDVADGSILRRVPLSPSKSERLCSKLGCSKTCCYKADEDNFETVATSTKTKSLRVDGTGTGTIASVESFSPVSGERSTLSDSGYSVTGNELPLTDTGYVLLDSASLASKVITTDQQAFDNRNKNVNAGPVHSLRRKGRKDSLLPSDKIKPIDASQNSAKGEEELRLIKTIQAHSDVENHRTTSPQAESYKKPHESSGMPNNLSSSSLVLSNLVSSGDTKKHERSKSGDRRRSPKFSRHEFETLKNRARSVEIMVPRRSRQRTGRKRACSISKERSLLIITTRTEETTFPKSDQTFPALGSTQVARKDSFGQNRSTSGISKSVHFALSSDIIDGSLSSGEELARLSGVSHKEVQTSPSRTKLFMTTDFPYSSRDSKVIVVERDSDIFIDTRDPANLNIVLRKSFGQEVSDENFSDKHSADAAVSRPTSSLTRPLQIDLNKTRISTSTFPGGMTGQKNVANGGASKLTDINRLFSNKSASDDLQCRSADAESESSSGSKSKKFGAISYFDGSKWLQMSSDDANSEDDFKKSLDDSSAGEVRHEHETKSVETQTSKNLGDHPSPTTHDQFSQTQPFASKEERHQQRDAVAAAGEKNNQGPNELPHAQSQNSTPPDSKFTIRRDSVKSIIAHEYGEMYSIFKEIPPTLTFLKASLISGEFNSNPDLQNVLVKYPSLRPGPWTWDQKECTRFGLCLAPTSAEQRKEIKIFDDTKDIGVIREMELEADSQFVSYRFEPVVEYFQLLSNN